MTSYINIHLQLTKEVLQAIAKDKAYVSRYKSIETIMTEIYGSVQREALAGKTKCIYKRCYYDFLNGQENQYMMDLMKKLESEFTSCKIEYIETKGYEGNIIERVIVIDWS
jgi:hypothetical protein